MRKEVYVGGRRVRGSKGEYDRGRVNERVGGRVKRKEGEREGV